MGAYCERWLNQDCITSSTNALAQHMETAGCHHSLEASKPVGCCCHFLSAVAHSHPSRHFKLNGGTPGLVRGTLLICINA